jgi:hypothetical protein
MKKLIFLVPFLLFANDLSSYKHINIEKNISASEIEKIKKLNAKFGFKLIKNPKFSCKDLGFSKVYMKSSTDSVVSIQYRENGKVCIENSYQKGHKSYGKEVLAVLN